MDDFTKLFGRVLNVDAASLSETTSPNSIPQWDSLAAMNLVSAIEETYGVSLSARDIMAMRTIGLARQVLAKKNVKV